MKAAASSEIDDVSMLGHVALSTCEKQNLYYCF